MLDLDPTVAKGRPKTGGLRMRAIRATALVEGFGVESGLWDIQEPAFHFHDAQMRAIKNTGRDKRQHPAEGSG